MLKLDWCSYDAAKYAAENWHYSGCVPNQKTLKIGVWESNRFVGCVMFGDGANQNIGKPYGLRSTEVCELTRVALRDHEAPVTRIVRVAITFLRRACPDIRLIISFADPEHGHVGGIYQGGNWIYAGVTTAADEYLVNGARMHGRALRSTRSTHKLKHLEATNVETWARKALNANVVRVVGSSKYRYLYPLDVSLLSTLKKLAQPYPKRGQSKENVAAPPSAEGGVIPTCPLQLWTDEEFEAEGMMMFRPVDISTQPRLDRLAPGELPDDGQSLFDMLQPEPPAPALSPSPAAPSLPSSAPTSLVLASPGQPAEVLRASLAARGHRLLTKDGRFFVSDAGRLTDEDRAAIKQHREHLIALAEPWESSPRVVVPDHEPVRQSAPSMHRAEQRPASRENAPDGAPINDSLFSNPRPTISLAQFLNPSPEAHYTPDEPPSLDGINEVVLNFETDGLQYWNGHRPVGVTVGTLDGGLRRFLPFAFKGGGNLDEAAVKRWAERELRSKKITNINTRFDLHFARVWGVDLIEQGNTFSDIAHTSAILDDYRRKFSLDALAEDFLGGSKIPRVDESRMAEHTVSEVSERARYQVQLVAELRAVLYPRLDAEDLRRVQALEDAVIPSVVECEKNAAHIDRPLLKRWVAESETKLNEMLWALARDVGSAINPDSAADWQKLFEHCGIPITERTATGAPSFTDALLKTIDHPLVQLARRAGKLASLRSKFLVAYDQAVSDDCKLRFSLHQLRVDDKGTVRGRFSMSDKNLQQVFAAGHQREAFGYDEKDSAHDDEIFLVRKLFIPERGLYLSADMDQVEFRIAAHYSGSAKIIDAYQQNPDVDFHQVVRDAVAPFKEITRSRAKALSFGKIYGSGRDTVARTLGLPRAEADQVVEIYDRMFPEMKALLRKAATLAETRGWVKTLTGRRARFPDKKFYHAALNYIVQGSAASVMKQKMVELHNERKTLGFTMRGSIHDEVVGDCEDAESARKVGEVLNRQSFDLKVPLTWSVGTGRNWAEAK